MSVLPVYVSSHFFFVPMGGKNPLQPPKEFLKEINQQIFKFEKARKEYLIGLTLSALLIFAFSGTVLLGIGSIISLRLIPVIMAVSLTILNRREYLKKYQEIKKQIDKYPRHFIFEDQEHAKTLCTPKEIENIQQYLSEDAVFEPKSGKELCIYARRIFEYTLEGGSEECLGLTPVSSKEKIVSDGEMEARKKYRPWIELLLFIGKAEKIPANHREQIGRAVGRMIFSYRWGQYRSKAVIREALLKVNGEITFENDRSQDGRTMCIAVCLNGEAKYFHQADEFKASLIQFYGLAIPEQPQAI